MSPASRKEFVQWTSPAAVLEPYDGPPRNIASIEALTFPSNLQPKNHSIAGTHPDSKILILDVEILEATGKLPYLGDVLIVGERFASVGVVPDKEALIKDPKIRVFYGNGRTLMPGLGDAHTHFSWNGGDIAGLGSLKTEEHTLQAAQSAACYLNSGYTMCFGAASAKERLDIIIRDAINAGDIPGPRSLANSREMARRDGALSQEISVLADGPEEMRKVINHHIQLGVDQIKLSMSGEEITEVRAANDCYFTDEETAACADEAHKQGYRLCAHARARDSVKMCVRHDIDLIYHASFIDEEGMDMLEEKKTRLIVAPGINWIIAILYDAAPFGYTTAKAEQVGYKKELDHAVRGLREMHKRGIVILPGGDFGFAWTPHGTYARDLAHFVNLLGFTAHESIIAATYGMAKLFMRSHEMGQIKPGNFADCILVDGKPLDNIEVLQEHKKLNIIIINGRVHKAGPAEYIAPAVAGQDINSH